MSIEMEMVKEHQRAIELIQDLISMGMRSDSSEERIKTFRKLDKYIHANMFKEIKKCGYCEEDFLARYKEGGISKEEFKAWLDNE